MDDSPKMMVVVPYQTNNDSWQRYQITIKKAILNSTNAIFDLKMIIIRLVIYVHIKTFLKFLKMDLALISQGQGPLPSL